MSQMVEVQGSGLEPYIDGLGELRIAVFREYPYLYDGSLDYERDYLRSYSQCPQSFVALVLDDGKVVGASTCIPMIHGDPEFQAPFIAAGHDLTRICYFGESMLLPSLRGRGLGKEFFARREAYAHRIAAKVTTFCAVDRPTDHHRRPQGYRPLDTFWHSQGYAQQPGLQATFHWKDLDDSDDTPKPMTFWTKGDLGP
jgi:GNAT superfamily N-acetyltransferase